MTEPFIGEIQLFGFNFPPRGWAFCAGQTVAIAQNTALFSLIGTTYGGNGQTTFMLPNFAGRAGCEQGNGPGLTPRSLGETFGVDQVTLTSNQIPQHNHGVIAYIPSNTGTPLPSSALSQPGSSANRPFIADTPNTTFAPNMIQPNQGGMPHQNQQPYLAVNFSIALSGMYPSFP